MRLALTWLASLIVFLALDTVWLGVVGGSLYTSVLGDIMPDQGFQHRTKGLQFGRPQ